MIVPKTAQPPFEADLSSLTQEQQDNIQSTRYRSDTDDYEVEFNGKFTPFEVLKSAITADGIDTTVCTAHTAVPVDFFVDDGEITKVTVDPAAGRAELEISAVSAGKIKIYVTIDKQYSTTIFAQ